jgi:hypothetical protein
MTVAQTTGLGELSQHDRPCGECLNYRRDLSGAYCAKKLMAVIAEMRAGYYQHPQIGQPGPCWEPANGE